MPSAEHILGQTGVALLGCAPAGPRWAAPPPIGKPSPPRWIQPPVLNPLATTSYPSQLSALNDLREGVDARVWSGMSTTDPKPRGRPPRPPQGRGEIRADALYPLGVLMRKLGIARNTLSSLRKRGLKVHFVGRRCGLIDGAELIQFLRNQWQQEGNVGDNQADLPVQSRENT